jgi:hypothetical protein
MKAPVWYLIGRISLITGGTGWHRSEIIDTAIRHFNEWWLVGTKNTAHWMPYVLPSYPNMADITNQFLLIGVNGGILTMVWFILLIVQCFKTIGNALRLSTLTSEKDSFFIWTLGCALIGHVVTFFSIAYFDQMIVFWYLLIGMIATLTSLTYGVESITVQIREQGEEDLEANY